jgi:lysophospholipase L1-like esterase
MRVQPSVIQRHPQTTHGVRNSTTLLTLKRFGVVSISLVIIAIVGVTLLPGFSLAHVLADGIAPSQPPSINGSPGNQQATLTWGAANYATGYFIEQTDLATGQVQQLPDMVTGTTFTVGSLAIGHWYRFRVIPVNGTIQGTASAPIEIRTTGFKGTYDHYYVLGDSYSAGEGAPPYSGVAGCFQSTQSYGFQLANGAPTPTMLACSGAITDNIDTTAQHPTLPGTQLQQLKKNSLSNSLITLTIGGNDVNFAKDLETCIFSVHSCTTQQATISQTITTLEPRLVQVYQEIRQTAPGADIIVLGYPLLFAAPDTARCHNLIIAAGMSKSEMTMIRTLAAQLDTVISQAAAQAGVVSAANEVEQGFAGHEACVANKNAEWINEITGLTMMVHGSFHPTAAGYAGDALAVNARRTSLYLTGMVRHV